MTVQMNQVFGAVRLIALAVYIFGHNHFILISAVREDTSVPVTTFRNSLRASNRYATHTDGYDRGLGAETSSPASVDRFIVRLELWNGASNRMITNLQANSNSAISFTASQLSSLNLLAVSQADLNNSTKFPGSVQFVLRRFNSDNTTTVIHKRTVNVSPYTMCLSSTCGTIFTNSRQLTTTYSVTAIPYLGESGTGAVGASTRSIFILSQSTNNNNAPVTSPNVRPIAVPSPVFVTTPVVPSNIIKSFQLIDISKQKVMMTLNNMTTIDLNDFAGVEFDLEVVVDTSIVAAVKFSNNISADGTAPFTFCRTNDASCRSNLRKVGVHTIFVRPIGFGNVRLGSRIMFQYKVIDSSSGDGSSTKAPLSTNGKWEIIQSSAPITARHESCTAMVNGKIYLIGGRNRAPIDIFDTSTSTWTVGPVPPIQIHHMQCVVADDKIWIVSAWTKSFPNEEAVDKVYVLNTNNLQWSTRTALPESRRRGGAASVLVGRRIYVSHGNRGGHAITNISTVQTLGWLDFYDIDTDTWTTNLPTAPNPRDHTGGALVKDGTMICVSGGRNGALVGWPAVAETDCYDLQKGKWSVQADIPVLRSGSSYGTTCDGKLMIAGGEGPRVVFNDVHIFDGSTWTTMPNISQARHGSGLSFDCSCTSTKKVYLPSGSGGPKGGPLLTSIEAYVVDQDESC